MAVRVDRVQLAIVETIAATTGAVGVWSPSNYPRAPGDGSAVITAKIARGPNLIGLRSFMSAEPTTVTWTVTGASAGDLVGIGLTSARWAYEVQVGDTDTDARDGLLALFSADSRQLPGVTVSASGADSIVFDSAGAVGALWRSSAIGPSTVVSVVDSNAVDCEVTTGRAEMLLELQAYASAGPDAASVLADLLGGLVSYDVMATRERLGVIFGGAAGDVVDLTAIAGADFESRASVRISAAMRTYRAVAVDTADTIEDGAIIIHNGAEQIPVDLAVP